MIFDIRWHYCLMGGAPRGAIHNGDLHSNVCQVLQVRYMDGDELTDWIDVSTHGIRTDQEAKK